MKKQKQGISLISLIITIIVIIILAAIVIFSGMGTPEKAQLSAVISDIDNVQTAVDQAYYGFYTEKSVAGEVWTKSQFYEAVATGETNRDNLTGTGIVPISKDGMVKMTLPNYEGRSWGVAVEDIDDHTQVGSVVLYPGFESDGKIYSTLLDVQNDGRDTQLTDGIQSSGTVKLADLLKVGDYVEYIPDTAEYTTDINNTGYTSAQTLNTETKDWRVLYVNSETGEVLLTTNGIVNDGTYLQGTKGYFRGPTELNNICKALYSNSSLGITARSMTVEDLNRACNYMPSEPTTRYAWYRTIFTEGDKTIEYNGKTYRKTTIVDGDTAEFYTSDGGGIEKTDSDGFTYRTPEADNPVYVTETHYYYQPSSKNSTVGSILGGYGGWLASPCVYFYSSYYACFDLRIAADSVISSRDLYFSVGGTDSPQLRDSSVSFSRLYAPNRYQRYSKRWKHISESMEDNQEVRFCTSGLFVRLRNRNFHNDSVSVKLSKM